MCLLTEHMTIVRQRIDVPVPRKRKGASGVHEKVVITHHSPPTPPCCSLIISFASSSQALDRFYKTLFEAVLRHLPYATLKAIVLASPGFTKDGVSFLSHTADASELHTHALNRGP